MKKIFCSLLAILLVAVGCTNEEKLLDEPVMRKSVNTVKASFEETAVTRTHFLNDTKLTWDAGDVIQVFSDKQKNASPFTYQGDNVFSGEAVNYDETIYAFYNPAGNAVVDWENKTVQATFPNLLVYNPDGYADPTFMVARSGNNELTFMQTVSILKFSLTGTKHITKLTLSGNNGEVIAGVGTIDLASNEPVLTFDGVGETSIVMQADVTLDAENSTSFYFQLPEMVLEAGFTLTLEGDDVTTGDSFKVEKRLDNRFVPKRSHVYSFTSMDVDEAIINGDGPSENAQPYYVIDGNTLTFYYDDQMDERAGAQPGWLHGEKYNNKVVVYAELTPSCRFYKPESTSYMFSDYVYLTSILGLEYLDTSNVTDMSWMFYGCPSLTSLDLSRFDTSNVTDMSDMFEGCSSLTSLDVSGFNTSNVTDMSEMFKGCSSLTSLNLSGFVTSNVMDMSDMFIDCSSLTSLDLSRFDTSNVTDMSEMFKGCSSLTSLDVSGFETLNVTRMDNMFSYCSSLTSLNVSGFDTPNVTSMDFMFLGCSSLTSLDLSDLDTSNVTSMYAMFSSCFSLTSLDVRGFDTSNVKDMRSMFFSCTSLTSLDVSGFVTSNVTDMGAMFINCSSLTSLDVSDFDTSNLTDMSWMFDGCSSLTSLDVSSFDTSKVTYMWGMFNGCSSLKTIYGGNWGYIISSTTNMFSGCNNLVGGQGSKLGDNNVYDDGRSAHIDGGPSNPGLFTQKP